MLLNIALSVLGLLLVLALAVVWKRSEWGGNAMGPSLLGWTFFLLAALGINLWRYFS